MKRRASVLPVLVATVAACSPSSPAPDATASSTPDVAVITPPADASLTDIVAVPLDAPADASVLEAAVPLPAMSPLLPPASLIASTARGYTAYRAIVHSHSVHSHDACDGMPYVDGGPNEPCLASFRRAVCQTQMDAVFMTEHAGLMADGSFERVMQMRAGDEPVMRDGQLAGYSIVCADGHRTLVLPGAENELMPVGMLHHPALTAGMTMGDAYHAYDPAGVARFHDTGALVALAHVEQRTLADMQSLEPDVIELYNVHANLAPNIAGPYLHFDVGPSLADLFRFVSPSNHLAPDLAVLSFFQESHVDLSFWSQLVLSGHHPSVVGGSDTHENTFVALLTDGERGDSYRRIYHFFANELLVRGAFTRESAMEALQHGRGFTTFEVFGTPEGFDAYARTDADTVHELGDTFAITGTTTIHLAVPHVHALDASLPAPTVTARVLRADASGTDGWTEVGSATHDLDVPVTTPGTYRTEVRINPTHLRAYLPGLERVVRDSPWIYTNAFVVTAVTPSGS